MMLPQDSAREVHVLQVVKGHNKTRIESSHFNEDDTVSFSPPRFSFRMMQLDQQIDLGQWDDPR